MRIGGLVRASHPVPCLAITAMTVLFAVAAALMIGVTAMTQAGFAGNLRYVALPAALIAVLAGAGWVELVRSTNRRLGPIAAGALYPLFGLLLSPVIAAAAMSLSSVSVIANALRLRSVKL